MANRRTILMLGGSRQQVIALQKARDLGFRTVLCDYLPDNPGQFAADAFYQVSTTDPAAVLTVAQQEGAQGVLAYSSDPAAPTAAFVAEQLGMATNPLASVNVLSEKHLFRAHLAKAGLPCPRAHAFPATTDARTLWQAVSEFHLPLVVKPTDSSGSKGVTIVRRQEQLPAAIAHGAAFSRNATLICEEYIERAYPDVVGGDVFVFDGQVRFWGLMDCLRDEANPLVPNGEKTPTRISPRQRAHIKEAVQTLVSSLGIRFGELNVEVLLAADDVPYILELGARAGGNMIPVQLSDASGIDLVAANILAAMGEDPGDLAWDGEGPCIATYVLHSATSGTYRGLTLDAAARTHLYRTVLYVEPGDPIAAFDGANKALGVLFFRFDAPQEMDAFFANVGEHVKIDRDGSICVS